jgi:general secretion pathway protein L
MVMQDRLIIFLAVDGTPSWVTVDANGQAAARVMSSDPETLATVAAGKEIIVVVPGEDVLLLSAVLPKLSRARLLQALPYAIEDQLTSDVETLHFVPATIQLDGITPVAVVAQNKMRHWLALLQSWRIQPDSLIPTTFVLPLEEDVWHVAVSTIAVARTGALTGFGCDTPQLGAWLGIALASAIKKPRLIHVHHYSNQKIASINLGVEIKEEVLPADQWYRDAAQQTSTPSINLLTTGFASRKASYPQWTKIRKAATYLLGIWLILLLLYPSVSYVTLKARLSSIQGQMWQLYKKQFPQATNMIAPKARFEEKLHKAGASLGQNRFLILLAYVGESLHNATGVTIKRMEFQSSLLTLDLTATTESFSKFTDYLSQQGLQVKQQNASVAGERVTATVQVE